MTHPSPPRAPRSRRARGACTALALGVALSPSLGDAGAPAGAAGPGGHAVFDLFANRPLAHLEQNGGLVVVAGAPSFARYVHFSRPTATWRLRFVEESRPVAIAQASANLEVPLSRAQAQGQVVYLRLKVQTRSSIKVSANGRVSPAVTLNPGWQTTEIKLPPGSLQAGENNLLLTFAEYGRFSMPGVPAFKAAAAVEWLQVGGSAPPANFTPARLADGERLVIPGGGALYYYAQLPAGGTLVTRGSGDGCKLEVTIAASADGKESTGPASLDGSPFDLGVDGKDAVRRLGLHARGSCGQLLLSSAGLVLPGAEPQVQKPSKPRNLIVWLTDDTRADRYRLWNSKSRVETPIMDEFSKRATRFSVAYVQGNESRVSHASLFTGLYPLQHKFIAPKAVLDSRFLILPEAAKEAGLFTIGHIANGYISKRWGFGDGWDVMRNHIHEGGGLKAADLVKAAETFMASANGRKPYFLYLGTIDAHVSWRAYEPWISKYDPKPYHGPFVKGCMDPQLDKIVAGQLPTTDRDRERIRALYDSDISYNDKQFGALLELLRKHNQLDDTMIVFTSDHGEEFWDHGRIGHGQSLRQELVHVPLLMYYPPLFPAGKVVEEGVDVLDVLPTVTDALQVATPKEIQGESLVGLAQGVGAGYPRPTIASQYELAHTMRLARWKLWVGGSGDVKLFDAISDPMEAHELSSERPLQRRFVTDALGLWMAYQSQWKKARWGVASNLRPAFAQDLEK